MLDVDTTEELELDSVDDTELLLGEVEEETELVDCVIGLTGELELLLVLCDELWLGCSVGT